MTSYVTPKINTAFITYVSLLSQADTKLAQANPTLAIGDVTVSTDGGSFANITTLPTVTPASGTGVKISLSAAEMNGDNILVRFKDAAGAEWCDLTINIQTTAQTLDDLDTIVDSILVDTNELQTDWTNGGRLDLLVDLILADTGTDGVVLSAATANAVADALLKRDIDQVEATAALHSLATAILKAVSRVRNNAGTLETYRTDGTTLHLSQTITTDATNDPIDELTAGT